MPKMCALKVSNKRHTLATLPSLATPTIKFGCLIWITTLYIGQEIMWSSYGLQIIWPILHALFLKIFAKCKYNFYFQIFVC